MISENTCLVAEKRMGGRNCERKVFDLCYKNLFLSFDFDGFYCVSF